MKGHHAFRKFATQFVDTGHQCLKVIAVFNAGYFRNFLESFQADQIRPQDCAIVEGGKLAAAYRRR